MFQCKFYLTGNHVGRHRNCTISNHVDSRCNHAISHYVDRHSIHAIGNHVDRQTDRLIILKLTGTLFSQSLVYFVAPTQIFYAGMTMREHRHTVKL